MKQSFDEKKQLRVSYTESLHRVESALADAELKSWEQVQAEIDKAVAFEKGAERLTRDEVALLSEWLRRDLSALMGFVQTTGQGLKDWLRFDLDLLEDRLRRSLLSIADQTQVDGFRLGHQLDHEEGSYVQGELALPGLLQCTDCGHLICLVGASQLESCHHCGNGYFRRVTRRSE